MFKITLLAIGKLKKSYFQEACLEYIKRLSPYAKIEIQELAAEKFFSSNQVKAQQLENQHLIDFLNKQSNNFVIVLDELGQEFTSVELATKIEKVNQEIVLVIGGSLGLSEEVRKKASLVLALGKLTLPHELARVVLLEQLYRAITIIKGKEYHH